MGYISITQITALLTVAAILLFVCGCGSLRQQSQDDQPIVFGIVADVQYADKDTVGARHYRTSLAKLVECVDELNGKDLSFVIQLGDIIEGGNKAENELDQILSLYNRLDAKKYHVPGNHDFTGISRRAVFEKMSIDRGYYDFTIGRWRFVVLDTMDVAVNGGWPEGSENYRSGAEMLARLTRTSAANAFAWNGGIGDEQMAWLDGVLSDADSKKQRTIVFAHHPVLPAGDAHNAWNSDKIVKVLQSHNCTAAYLSGHNHAGAYAIQNGAHYVTFKAMVESPVKNAYALIELGTDKISIVGFGNEPTRQLLLDAPLPAAKAERSTGSE